MKIACIDCSASARIALQRFLDDLYLQHRQSVGHLSLATTFPATLEQTLVNAAPDVVAIGSGFSLEDAYLACRRVRSTHPDTPLLLFLSSDAYSLRSLRRFHDVADDVFSIAEPPVRLLHRLASLSARSTRARTGKLIVFDGVKGGVGVTSLVAAYAHAAETLGKRAVIIDLSPNGALIQFMLPSRWHSPDYAAALVDGLVPDTRFVERCLTSAPNGVNLLLPPSGGGEIRELWLRHPERFELTLSIVELLREMFDLVLVDTGGAEGVLCFALIAHANSVTLVSSNEPAAIHLLGSKLSALGDTLADTGRHLLLNTIAERGLTKSDVMDFLYSGDEREQSLLLLEPIPYDARGRNWIGTGNTFYTEATRSTQRTIESQLMVLTGDAEEREETRREPLSLLGPLKRFAERSCRPRAIEKSARSIPQPLALPTPLVQMSPTAPASDVEHDSQMTYSFPIATEDNSLDEATTGNMELYYAPQPVIEGDDYDSRNGIAALSR